MLGQLIPFPISGVVIEVKLRAYLSCSFLPFPNQSFKIFFSFLAEGHSEKYCAMYLCIPICLKDQKTLEQL